MNYDTFLHTHGLFAFIIIILFFLTMVFIYTGQNKVAKVFQMILRLLYILIFVTGAGLVLFNFQLGTLLKGLVSFWLIYVMEMIGTRKSKNELSFKMELFLWIQFTAALLLVFYFAYMY